MSICQICKYQAPDDSATYCPNCGAALKPPRPEDDEESVPEVRLPDEPASAVTEEPLQEGDSPVGENLEICHPGDMMGAGDETARTENAESENVGEQEAEDGSATPAPAEADGGTAQMHKLSAEEAEKIRSSFYAEPEESDEISAEDASALFRKMSGPPADEPSPEEPVEKPAAEATHKIAIAAIPAAAAADHASPNPEEPEGFLQSPPVRHPAYFRKNVIQLTGAYLPATGDELVIGDRHYLLRPKKVKPQYIFAGFAAALLVAIVFIAAQFLSPTLPGVGDVVGVVVDQDGRPIRTGAKISLPEAGQNTTVDGFGFFRFEQVPTGTYVIRCQLPDGSLKTDNVSVIDDQVTTIALVPQPNAADQYTTAADGDPTPAVTGAPEPAPVRQSSGSTPAATAPAVPSGGKGASALKLEANLADAKLIVDNEVLGVGNLVYKKLSPGAHSVSVSRDGYVAWKGSIKLNANETYTLTVDLEPAGSPTTPSSTYAAEDFYQSGKSQLSAGNAAAAVDDFAEAIALKPGMADAYLGRGEAYLQVNNQAAAESDFIKAGEIYIGQKRYQTAQDLFTRVIDANKRSIAGLLARAALFDRRDDKPSAIADYERVLKLDKDNFQANCELGRLFLAAGQNKEADKRLRKAQELDPNVPEVYHLLMLNYFARDDFAKVKKTYADFTLNIPNDQVQSFKTDPRYDAILRIVGEYQRP